MASKVKIIINFTAFEDFSLIETMFKNSKYTNSHLKNLKISMFVKKKQKKLLILRSPFVNKKARNQFGFSFYKGFISFQLYFNNLNINFLSILLIWIKKVFLKTKIFNNIKIKKTSKYF